MRIYVYTDSLGSLFTRLLNLAEGICFSSATISEIHWCWVRSSSSQFQFTPKMLDGGHGIRALCILFKFFHTKSKKLFLGGPLYFMHDGAVDKGSFPKQVWKHVLVYHCITIVYQRSTRKYVDTVANSQCSIYAIFPNSTGCRSVHTEALKPTLDVGAVDDCWFLDYRQLQTGLV